MEFILLLLISVAISEIATYSQTCMYLYHSHNSDAGCNKPAVERPRRPITVTGSLVTHVPVTSALWYTSIVSIVAP